jgi:hypothetical protein
MEGHGEWKDAFTLVHLPRRTCTHTNIEHLPIAARHHDLGAHCKTRIERSRFAYSSY